MYSASGPGRPDDAATGSSHAVWAASSREVLGRTGLRVKGCVSCGLALSDQARFCRRCGTQQPDGERQAASTSTPPAAAGAGGRRRPRFAPQVRLAGLAVLALALVLGASPWIGGSARAAGPKVVFIVGPVAEFTSEYKAYADQGVKVAKTLTSNVVTVYTPNATWPAVKSALQGASLVVYLGHGNGWPSPYSDALVPEYQDGLGLNPVAGVDDVAHQYFGESYLAREVKLAPHAVVLLHHLCYASGNSEPDLPTGPLAYSEARVDNYAAGWMAAGADAVLADAAFGPAWYVNAILSGAGTMESIWRSSPSFHDNVIAFPSRRTPGLTALLDPTTSKGPFFRSLVGKANLRASEVARGASLAKQASDTTFLPEAGPTVTATSLDGLPVAGSKATLSVTLADGTKNAAGLKLGIRWDPIATDPVPTPSTDPGASGAPDIAPGAGRIPDGDSNPDLAGTGSASPSPSPKPSNAAKPSAKPSPSATASPRASAAASGRASSGASPGASGASSPSGSPGSSTDPTVLKTLVKPEVPGDLVLVNGTKPKGHGVTATLSVPARPGLYRLVITLHDADGVAYDAATQALVPALIVRVTGRLSASVTAPATVELPAGSTTLVPVSIANTGSLAWTEPPLPPLVEGAQPPESVPPSLVARWIPLDSGLPPVSPDRIVQSAGDVEPGSSESVSLVVTAPPVQGAYLLVLDVASPIYGSLTAVGLNPASIRIVVDPPIDLGQPSGPAQ